MTKLSRRAKRKREKEGGNQPGKTYLSDKMNSKLIQLSRIVKSVKTTGSSRKRNLDPESTAEVSYLYSLFYLTTLYLPVTSISVDQ